MSPVTDMSSDTLIKVEHLSMKFGGLMAINDFSFEAKRGDITALIGPNGAGKTTVFNCITGFYKPTGGTIRLRRLPIGRAWEALREDEVACRALGINTTTTKLTAFATGAMFGGFAGAFFATRQGFISPESFTFQESALVLAIVVLGGMGSQLGVALAAIAMIGGFELFRGLDQYRMLVFGFAMVLLMIWRPRGLIGHRAPTVYLERNQAISSDLVKEGHG